MRKYYSKKHAAHAASGLTTTLPSPWDLLSAFSKGCVDILDDSLIQRIDVICSSKSVKAYLELSSELDRMSQRYTCDTNPDLVFAHRQIACLLKKFPFTEKESGIDPRSVAISKLLEAEKQCLNSNFRIGFTSHDELPSWVPRAKHLIAELIGDLTPDVIMKIITGGTHGPGGTLSSRGNRVTEYYKYADLPYTVTENAAPYAFAAISANSQWMEILENSGRRTEITPFNAPQSYKDLTILKDCVELVSDDKITFVPKDARTERPIAVGASLNMYLQLGVKTWLQKRLLRVGLDLSDQETNQRLAYEGSRYSFIKGIKNPNQFATIDLASASDTISYELVKLLLPPDWFALLCDLRHESGAIGSESFKYEKFSAMGNGFTFPLESLIFWAVAKAAILQDGYPCLQSDIAVYGDDIIIREKCVGSALRALTWSGFTVNHEKSFFSGPFKESCGADYFLGTDVRPFYLKRRLDHAQDYYFVCNQTNIKARARPHKAGLSGIFNCCLTALPKSSRIYIPMDSGSDIGLQVPHSYLSSLGLRPWLSDSEKYSLLKSNLLKPEDFDLQTQYAWHVSDTPRPYSGKAAVRLMIALDKRSKTHKFTKLEDFLHVEAACSGIVTRRNALKRIVKVRPVPNWNGLHIHEELAVNLVWSSDRIK